MSNQYLNNEMFKKINNESTNIDKSLINAAYRRFLLRNCNNKTSILRFMHKLNIGPNNLNLLRDEKYLKNLFLKFEYKDSYLTHQEENCINLTEYKLESFKGKLYTNDNYKEMNNSDIIHCYNRFLVKCCENKMSLLYFAEKLNNLYPDRLGLYYENKIFKFFKSFLYFSIRIIN